MFTVKSSSRSVKEAENKIEVNKLTNIYILIYKYKDLTYTVHVNDIVFSLDMVHILTNILSCI
jgi:hypothetical protein